MVSSAVLSGLVEPSSDVNVGSFSDVVSFVLVCSSEPNERPGEGRDGSAASLFDTVDCSL